MPARSSKSTPLPVNQTIHMLMSATAGVAAAPAMPEHRWPEITERTASGDHPRQKTTSSTAEPSVKIPGYVAAPSAISAKGTAKFAGKGLIVALRDTSMMCPPLRTALGGLVVIWDRIDDMSDVQDDYSELASKLKALDGILIKYNGEQPGNENLKERLEAIAAAVEQLTEAIKAKLDRGKSARAAQSTEDIKVVRITFRRVSSLLEVFQLEGQLRTETMLATIIEQLKTTEQRTLTAEGETAGDSEKVVNNNSNENELEGPVDLDNNNANETELEIEGPGGGGIVNNNSNVNRIAGSGGFSPGTTNATGSSTPGVEGPMSRTRISNNNSNKNVVRRIAGSQAARSSGTAVQQSEPSLSNTQVTH